MIKELRIQNFRCFSTLNLSDLTRVNVVVGPSASGKTALLESMFLSSTPNAPSIAFNLRAHRRLGQQIGLQAEASSYIALWQDLFHDLNEQAPISIEIIGTDGDSRSLLIYLGSPEEQVLPFGKSQSMSPAIFPQMTFEWKRGSQAPIVVRPKISEQGLVIQVGSAEHFPVALFGPNAFDPPQETARRFSELSKTGNEEEIVKILKQEFPIIEALSIEFSLAIPNLFASIKGQKIKLPVGLVSEGINKLLSILIGIRTYRNGVVLLDQIEDGFYFEQLPSLWRVIHKFAVDNNVQIVAASHSLECLKAMSSTVKKHPEDFMLLRAKRDNGSSTIVQIKGSLLESALEQGFNVRCFAPELLDTELSVFMQQLRVQGAAGVPGLA